MGVVYKGVHGRGLGWVDGWVGGWMGGWVGGGTGVVGVGGKPKVSSPCHEGTDSDAVPPVGDRDVHNPQDRSKQPLATV